MDTCGSRTVTALTHCDGLRLGTNHRLWSDHRLWSVFGVCTRGEFDAVFKIGWVRSWKLHNRVSGNLRCRGRKLVRDRCRGFGFRLGFGPRLDLGLRLGLGVCLGCEGGQPWDHYRPPGDGTRVLGWPSCSAARGTVVVERDGHASPPERITSGVLRLRLRTFLNPVHITGGQVAARSDARMKRTSTNQLLCEAHACKTCRTTFGDVAVHSGRTTHTSICAASGTMTIPASPPSNVARSTIKALAECECIIPVMQSRRAVRSAVNPVVPTVVTASGVGIALMSSGVVAPTWLSRPSIWVSS